MLRLEHLMHGDYLAKAPRTDGFDRRPRASASRRRQCLKVCTCAGLVDVLFR